MDNMPYVLDHIAEALHVAQGSQLPRRVLASAELRHQFRLPVTPSRWAQVGRCLSCPLPPLNRRPEGLWSFPRGWATVWDIAAYLSPRSPHETPSPVGIAAEWQEAQIFVGVRVCLMEALNRSEKEVVRSARLMADLGAD